MADNNELSDVQGNMALKMLQELLQQGKITNDNFTQYQKFFQRLHSTIMKTFQNQKVLPAKAKKLQQDLKFKQDEYEQAQIKSEEAEANLKKIQIEVKKLESEEDILKKQQDQLQAELDKLMILNSEQEIRIKEEEQETRNKIQFDVERLTTDIQNFQDDIKEKTKHLEKEQLLASKYGEDTKRLKKENDEILNDSSKLQNEIFQIRDEPIRFEKKAEMLRTANEKMNKDLSIIIEDIQKKDKIISEQKVKIEQRKIKVQEIEEQIKKETQGLNDIAVSIKDYKQKQKQINLVIEDEAHKRYENNIIIDTELKNIKHNKDIINQKKKEIQHIKKQIRKEEQQINIYNDDLRDLEMTKDKQQKEEAEYKYEIKKQQEIRITIDEELKLTEYKKTLVKEKILDKEKEKEKVNEQIKDLEKQLSENQEFGQGAMKKVKTLTAMRESMARKASSAMAEVRETREELKIKELLILDLTKKHQETEFKLNHFKALYEEVKSARNKYVRQIQDSQQHLAELKERIKILQNELEILKNESQEKDGTIIQYKHIIQLETHKRDRTKTKLDKKQILRRQKKEQVDQNINEIDKLNMIIMSLEKEMLQLRKKYEEACENRNFIGIGLIDRNDELCILYEKSNIQENILKNGETEIKKLEDEIRMIKIEIQEKQRQIDVQRKSIQLVPKLADKVIELKNSLELEKEKEKQLSNELENPQNMNRWRELKGEDPDQEAIEAKIHVLEERLNNKKEQLLEKELILDEITNLSEKLRKQALEGRQSTLELSEKLNDFQARLKDITRKMMASISELSMFQATAIKLQQERDELDKIAEEAQKRSDDGLPPTPETEIEYLKQQRDKERYLEERQQRLQKEAIEKNFPPFATKTTAEHRVNAYIPDDIGLPKPYGKNAPFKPSEVGVNIRHIRKPKQKEIEV